MAQGRGIQSTRGPHRLLASLAVAAAMVAGIMTLAPVAEVGAVPHSILTVPKAREGSNGPDNLGIKIPAPKDQEQFNTCGGTSPGKPVATLTAGQPTTVKWDITIDHTSDPGVTVAMRCDPKGQFTKLASGVTVQNNQTQVTVPQNMNGNCELQYIWTSKEDGGSYISCADVTVQGGSGGTSGGSSGSGNSTTGRPTTGSGTNASGASNSRASGAASVRPEAIGLAAICASAAFVAL